MTEQSSALGTEFALDEAAVAAHDGPTLELRGVRKVYETGGETVVALGDGSGESATGIDFVVAPGEFVAIVGPSGSGKSTLLNMLGLLDEPTAGERYLLGRDVTTLDDEAQTNARKEAIGFVFQDFYLIPTLTATENVELPTIFEDDPDATERARDLLRRVGLADRLDHTPNELSGGQKQRVAIARALVNRPRVVLADEPTGNLDQETGAQILDEFRRVCEAGVSVVAVTHDPQVTEYADRTVRLVDGVVRERDAAGAGGDVVDVRSMDDENRDAESEGGA
ncbi:ABC transporter ATP-binding protein [Haloprofundus sp. MHR1]|uniref:ABC transporter ATP-binding protein n=1 Tax=Haloprofundus sp. MHR1 TaxID=2572921 RepID=UPI0010BEB777|nr:ABC transporter ATP-binding protein [Haloprofundus sp. MHR1]QCJ47211.1 ABC transporter ATP-binding protein [Haloprofundus sp. MHR1]